MAEQRNDPGAHYRYSMKVRVTREDFERGYVEANVDPYRISAIYQLGGGPREHVAKKALRGVDKGHTERELLAELRCCLDRWEQMLDEDEAADSAPATEDTPYPDLKGDLARRIADWTANGDTGTSSLAMLAAALGNTPDDPSAPHDVGDLGRCIGLVKAVPEVLVCRSRIAELSPAWANVVGNWSVLHRLWQAATDPHCPHRDDARERLRGHFDHIRKLGG